MLSVVVTDAQVLREVAESWLFDGDTDTPLPGCHEVNEVVTAAADELDRLRAALAVAVQRAETAEAKVQRARDWLAHADPLPHLNGDKFADLRAALSSPVQPRPSSDEEEASDGLASNRP